MRDSLVALLILAVLAGALLFAAVAYREHGERKYIQGLYDASKLIRYDSTFVNATRRGAK